MDSDEFAKIFDAASQNAKKMAGPSNIPGQRYISGQELENMLDVITHSRNSHAEEATAEELRRLVAQYEADKKEQAKGNRISRIYNLVALLVAIASMIIALVK